MSSRVYINPPSLPSSVSGDGRHVMTLLKKFVNEVAEQVNVINGYSVDSEDSSIPVPKYFYLQFNNIGYEFSWTTIDYADFDHYELRLNRNTGSRLGLLTSTTEIKAAPSLTSRAGTIYLYVVNTSGEYSSPVILNYSKSLPISPEDVAVSKTDEGTLIFFSGIPNDCLGAVIYINGIEYRTTTNSFLYSGIASVADVIVAYYDSFGVGESSDIYFDPPLVKGFIVERNDCYLDFRWQNVNLYNARYVIKQHDSINWDAGQVIAEVKTNSFRYVFPNDGTFVFMIKVFDQHGNSSDDCTYVTLETVPDIYRNVVLLDSQAPDFTGSSFNLERNSVNGTIKLPKGKSSGVYFSHISLPQKYRARNWVDYNQYSYSDSKRTWDECIFPWSSSSAEFSWAGDMAENSSSVKNEISTYVGVPSNLVDYISFDNSLKSYAGTNPVSVIGESYDSCYFTNGFVVTPFSSTIYNISLPENFSLLFVARFNSATQNSGKFLELLGIGCQLCLLYDFNDRRFVLSDYNADNANVQFDFSEKDVLFFCLTCYNGVKKLFIRSMISDKISSSFSVFNGGTFNEIKVGNNVEVLNV